MRRDVTTLTFYQLSGNSQTQAGVADARAFPFNQDNRPGSGSPVAASKK